MANLQHYYEREEVRRRMVEFLGGPCLEEATCAYVTAEGDSSPPDFRPRMPGELWTCLEQGLEVSRSLWDRRSLLLHVDMEYVNFDYPAEPYLDPERSLELQQPVIRGLQEHLLAYGIAPLHLLSGRGHHLVWRVSRGSRAFRRLNELGTVADTLEGIYRQPQPPRGEAVGNELGAAFAGAGQTLEFLAHQVLAELRRSPSVPVQVTDVETARGMRGREVVCLDLSEYGDPLNTRIVRIPFSVYHKPLQYRAALGRHIVDNMPPLFLVPLFEMDRRQGLLAMRDPLVAAELARAASVDIPDQSEGTERLVEAYAASSTAAFHRWFYSREHEPPDRWPQTYDRTPLNALPPCARRILVQPNDSLLKPAGIRHVVRSLLALGWHPRHIAGLIRSKYERNFGWGHTFYHYDAAARADFYTRLFAGLIALGHDALDDFQCKDLRAIGYCTQADCNESLTHYRASLAERRRHERLAGRPLNGLFLPNEHIGLPGGDPQQRFRAD